MSAPAEADPHLLALLREVEQKSIELHNALIDLERRYIAASGVRVMPECAEDDAWAALCTSRVVHERLGVLQAILTQYVPQRATQVMNIVFHTLAHVAPLQLQSVADSLAQGMTRAAMLCNCGTCEFCLLKNLGGERAEREITARMRTMIELQSPPKAADSARFGPDGKWLS